MIRKVLSCMVVVLCSYLLSCATPQFFTVTVYDSPSRNVRLQTMPVMDEGKANSHPSSITDEQMKQVLRGLYVEVDNSTVVVPSFSDSGEGSRRRAFSDNEVKFFTPLFVEGLQRATPEEIVTFFETAEISDLYEVTTSGGVFVKDNALHVILSNYSVKTQIWQDNDAYEAPYRLSPLEPIDPEPGRLVFEPAQFMVPIESAGWFETLKGKPWHAAVSYADLPE